MNSRPNRRRTRLSQDPAFFRKAVIAGLLTFLAAMSFFGLDILHWAFLANSGVSAVAPIREWINQSIAFKIGLLAVWGYVVMDLSLTGGEALAIGPYPRFARHLGMVPERLEAFQPREGDENFLIVSDAYNDMLQRVAAERESVRQLLRERSGPQAEELLAELERIYRGE